MWTGGQDESTLLKDIRGLGQRKWYTDFSIRLLRKVYKTGFHPVYLSTYELKLNLRESFRGWNTSGIVIFHDLGTVLMIPG